MRPLFARSLSLVLLAAISCIGLTACATTNLSTPDGLRYSSGKDIDIDGLEVRKEFFENGQPKLIIAKVARGGGNASDVNAASWQGFNAALQQGVQIGAALARAGLGLPAAPAIIPATLPPAATPSPPPAQPPPPAAPAEPANPTPQ